jgi:hypothetical protein
MADKEGGSWPKAVLVLNVSRGKKDACYSRCFLAILDGICYEMLPGSSFKIFEAHSPL